MRTDHRIDCGNGLHATSDGDFIYTGATGESARGNTSRIYRLLSTLELSKLPAQQWIVKGALPDSGTAALFGPSGSGKTFLALDLAGAISSGRRWFGFRTRKTAVIYCALEGEAGIQKRVDAYTASHTAKLADVHFIVQPFNLRASDDRAALVEAIRATGIKAPVVILDTLNRAAPGVDENSSRDMGEVIAATKAIQYELGGLVLLVHHTGKNAAMGLRGHSSLHAALDSAVEVTRDGDARAWTLAKSKDGEDGGDHPFALEVVELGMDDDGDPITSCVVRPQDMRDAEKPRKPKTPSGGNQKTAWDWLEPELRRRSSIPLNLKTAFTP